MIILMEDRITGMHCVPDSWIPFRIFPHAEFSSSIYGPGNTGNKGRIKPKPPFFDLIIKIRHIQPDGNRITAWKLLRIIFVMFFSFPFFLINPSKHTSSYSSISYPPMTTGIFRTSSTFSSNTPSRFG